MTALNYMINNAFLLQGITWLVHESLLNPLEQGNERFQHIQRYQPIRKLLLTSLYSDASIHFSSLNQKKVVFNKTLCWSTFNSRWSKLCFRYSTATNELSYRTTLALTYTLRQLTKLWTWDTVVYFHGGKFQNH